MLQKSCSIFLVICTESFSSRLLLCFAARKHFVGLGRVAAGEDELNFLFGLRLISILLVILCHKIGFTSAGPFKNPTFAEKVCILHKNVYIIFLQYKIN